MINYFSLKNLLPIALIIVIAIGFNYQQEQALAIANKENTITTLAKVRADLEKELNARLFLARGVAAFASEKPDMSLDEFNALIDRVYSQETGVRSIQWAPNAIVKYSYPLAGNELSIGHNLLQDPTRREDAEKSIREQAYIVTGPVNLLQGGTAIVARYPVYNRYEKTTIPKFIGFAIIVIDMYQLYEAAKFNSIESNYYIAIRRHDESNIKYATVHGDPSIFDSEDSVKSEITLPYSHWDIAIKQRYPNTYKNETRFATIILTLLFSLLILYLNWRADFAHMQMRKMALFDSLTNLPNRRHIFQYLSSLIGKTNRKNEIACLFLDLDGFKGINDTYGHDAGDKVLMEFSNRLKSSVGKYDMVSRNSGDEFIIILQNITDISQVINVAETILSKLEKPITIDDNNLEVTISVSIGIAVTNESKDHTAQDLIIEADHAMYEAKRAGKNTYKISQA